MLPVVQWMTRACPLRLSGRQPSGGSTRKRKQQHADVLTLDSRSFTFPNHFQQALVWESSLSALKQGKKEWGGRKPQVLGAEGRVVHVMPDTCTPCPRAPPPPCPRAPPLFIVVVEYMLRILRF